MTDPLYLLLYLISCTLFQTEQNFQHSNIIQCDSRNEPSVAPSNQPSICTRIHWHRFDFWHNHHICDHLVCHPKLSFVFDVFTSLMPDITGATMKISAITAVTFAMVVALAAPVQNDAWLNNEHITRSSATNLTELQAGCFWNGYPPACTAACPFGYFEQQRRRCLGGSCCHVGYVYLCCSNEV